MPNQAPLSELQRFESDFQTFHRMYTVKALGQRAKVSLCFTFVVIVVHCNFNVLQNKQLDSVGDMRDLR